MRGKVLVSSKQPDCPPGVSFPRVPERGCSWRVAAPRCAGPGERAAVSVSWDSAAAAACRDPDTAPVRQHTFTRTLGPINSVIIGFVARLLEDNTSQNVYKSHVCVLKLCIVIVFNILHSKLQWEHSKTSSPCKSMPLLWQGDAVHRQEREREREWIIFIWPQGRTIIYFTGAVALTICAPQFLKLPFWDCVSCCSESRAIWADAASCYIILIIETPNIEKSFHFFELISNYGADSLWVAAFFRGPLQQQ